jgi:ribosome-associated toxin RatA of RatAB toxin-antitoxin module
LDRVATTVHIVIHDATPRNAGPRVRLSGVKHLRGTATAAVAAPVEECLALLEAVDAYPNWYPEVVQEVEVIEANDDGRPTKARTTLHVSQGPIVKDFNLLLAITVDRPTTVKLSRIPNDASDQQRFDVTWQLDEHGTTSIRLGLDANLSVPRFIPIGSVGNAIAEGFVRAASRELDARAG